MVVMAGGLIAGCDQPVWMLVRSGGVAVVCDRKVWMLVRLWYGCWM